MTTLDRKVESARDLVRRCIVDRQRPIVMSSFGKDSMVMMSIVDDVVSNGYGSAKSLPVLFHREPFSPQKYDFANKVISDRGYVVYDYAPISTSVCKGNGHIEIMNSYQIGANDVLDLPTGIKPPIDGRRYLCGFFDLYCKPLGSFGFPWDLVFVGHKSSDVDPLLGPVPLSVDVATHVGVPNYSFPLRHFTDADVWEYAEQHGLPIHDTRYDPANGYRERDDISMNPDYHLACTACIDPDGPVSVHCPKTKLEILNRSPRIRIMGADRRYSYCNRRTYALDENGG